MLSHVDDIYASGQCTDDIHTSGRCVDNICHLPVKSRPKSQSHVIHTSSTHHLHVVHSEISTPENIYT